MRKGLCIGPTHEFIWINIALFNVVIIEVFTPYTLQEFRLIGHRFGLFVKARNEGIGMRFTAFDPNHQAVLGEFAQQWIIRVSRINPLANRPARVADKIIIAID